MAIDWTRKQGDTAPALAIALRDNPLPGQRVGAVVDLTGVTEVRAIIRRGRDEVLVHEDPAQIDDHATGQVSVVLTPTISSVPGLYEVEFVATWPDRQTTYPHHANEPHFGLMIQGDLASASVPAAPIPPGTGQPPSGGIMEWDGTDWVVDPDARHYVRYLADSDPDPTSIMNRNDILITVQP